MDNNIFIPTEILLPEGADLQKWSVVACDQYSSQPEYWEQVGRFVGEEPSSLNMIVPEAALKEGAQERISGANAAMKQYLARGIFRALPETMIYIERTLRGGKIRRGLLGALDLEAYDFNPGAKSEIRATEGTVLERLPARVKVREHAPLELPHGMVLVDDPACSLIEPLAEGLRGTEPIYDFDLMQESGHLRGYAVTGELLSTALAAFGALAEKAKAAGLPAIAVGDGNHSLAAAKLCWEKIKKDLSALQRESHPARWALAEMVNLRDPALVFEPIHRVVFGVDRGKLAGELAAAQVDVGDVGALQAFLDAYTAENGGSVDYIHGANVAERLGKEAGNVAFLLPAMNKAALIPMVVRDGALPRKAFSMGEAEDKRFYLEARRISAPER